MLAGMIAGLVVAAVLAPLVERRLGNAAAWVLGVPPLAFVAVVLTHLPQGTAVTLAEARPWLGELGAELAFAVDGLSAVMALLVAGIGALIVVYAGGYMAGKATRGRFLAYLLAFLAAMLGLVLADNVITLFVFWEATSVVSFLLIGFDHERAESRAAAVRALLITGAGGLALLAGLVLAGLAAGDLGLAGAQAWRFSAWAAVDLRQHPHYPAILALIVAGTATKSAQWPFHFWLPGAMAAPTPVSALLHSATMVKAGVFLLARLSPHLGGTAQWRWLVIGAGVTTMLVGAGMALGQRDLKRILAYTTVSVLGTLTMLLGVGTALAVKSAVVLLVAHAMYKAALFLVAGNIDHATGTRDVTALGGLARALPWTAAAAVLAALSMAGAPPMFGFVGKELLYTSKLDLEALGAKLVVAAVVANIALVAAAGQVAVKPFFFPWRQPPHQPHEAPPAMLLGPLLLGLAGLFVGLVPAVFDQTLGPAMASAILGREQDMTLKLWHGMSLEALTVLALSAVTVSGGVGLFFVLRRRLGVAARLVAQASVIGPTRGFDAFLAALPKLAARVTAVVQTPSLGRSVAVAIAATLSVAAPPLLIGDFPRLRAGMAGAGIHEVVLSLLILAGAVMAVALRSRLAAVVALGLTGIGIALLFALLSAPDLAMTQIMVESLTVILLVLLFAHLPPSPDRSSRGQRLRDALLACAAGLLMATFVLAVLPGQFPATTAQFYADRSLAEAFGRNVVNVILVDFRAFDTLGEITVVALAGLGVWGLLRLRLDDPRGDDR